MLSVLAITCMVVMMVMVVLQVVVVMVIVGDVGDGDSGGGGDGEDGDSVCVFAGKQLGTQLTLDLRLTCGVTTARPKIPKAPPLLLAALPLLVQHTHMHIL